MDLRLDCWLHELSLSCGSNIVYAGAKGYNLKFLLIENLQSKLTHKCFLNTNAQAKNPESSNVVASYTLLYLPGLPAAAFANNRNKIIIHEYVPFEY